MRPMKGSLKKSIAPINNKVKSVTYSVSLILIFISAFLFSAQFLLAENTQQYSTFNLGAGFFNQKVNQSSKYQTFDFLAANHFNYKKNNLSYKHNAGVFYQTAESFNTLDYFVPEAYLNYEINNHNMSFGRKKQTLSLVDEEWSLGLTQPLFIHDPINPISQGKFGLHHTYKKNTFYIKTFVTYFHLPHQGPEFKNKNEKIQFGSPWFSKPPERVKEAGGTSEVRYKVNKPTVADVVLQPSGSVQVGMNSKHISWDLGYANQIGHEFYKSYKFSQETNPDFIFVEADGSTYRQQLITANIAYKNLDFLSWVSYLKDIPVGNYKKDRTWLETRLDTQDWISFGFAQQNFIIPNLTLSTSYINRFDKEKGKETVLGIQELTSIIGRSYFERSNSVNLKVSYKRTVNKRDELSLSSRFEYSLKDKSQLSVVRAKYKTKKYNAFLEGGILSAGEDEKGVSFQSKFKGNDYINLGVGYVF